ncbi:hypothetical protein AVEN_214989-1 [Araneus ventricosus]|uniref:Uncharacterized protein n=1 Tax=Araneus ventricosus TaxID=182803 RepID=A0A4Y2Q8U3_ARAVE|nr:hypothetical protein AVEN_239701-1 [Araneus ventricosus]GBN59052.1 hypothetical protein AVEN_214989-1 [Araneus ventricosus]
MAGNKKLNFKGGVDNLVRHHFLGLRVENPGVELVSKLMSDVNSDVIASIEKDFKSARLVDEGAFRHFAQKAITKVFPGVLARNALSEALKQLALLQSGCITYGDDDRVTQQLQRRRESGASESVKRKKEERVANQFKNGVKKAFANLLPALSLDARAAQLLGHRIHKFAKIVADQASKTYEKKEELQPVDIQKIISKYLETKAMSAANSEGSKCLVLFENGLIDFKPRRTIKSGWSQETVAQEQIFSSVFKPGIKSLLNEASPEAVTDAKAPKFLGHILMEVGRYLAETTADTCKKKKNPELGNEELGRTLTAAFPGELKEHADLHASDDVTKYMEGLLLYERAPEKPMKRKAQTVRKSPAKKRRQPPKGRSTSRKSRSPSKRSSSKSSATKLGKKKPPSSERKARVQAPAPKKSVFAPLLSETVPAIFANAEVALARDASNNAGGMLEDVYQALVKVALSRAENSGELGQEQVVEAVFEVLPKQLADHSVQTK